MEAGGGCWNSGEMELELETGDGRRWLWATGSGGGWSRRMWKGAGASGWRRWSREDAADLGRGWLYLPDLFYVIFKVVWIIQF